jgi:16S rRNA U1498 N3-methylase RsmE
MSSTPRFFVPPDAIAGDRVVLPPDDAHHARSVLRLRAGEPIFVHDGRTTFFDARLKR